MTSNSSRNAIKTTLFNRKLRIAIALIVIGITCYLQLFELRRIIASLAVGLDFWASAIRIGAVIAIAGLALSTLAASALSSNFWKWPLFILFALSLLVNETFYAASGHSINYTDWLLLWQARANIGDALQQYSGDLAYAVLGTVPLLAGFIIMPSVRRRVWPYAVSGFVLSITLFVVVCFVKQGRATQDFAPSTNVYGMLVASVFDRAPATYIYTTDTLPTSAPIAKHITLVIDESVRDDFFTHVVLPEIQNQPTQWHIYNFGTATSMANCSATSGIMMRKMVSPNHISRDLYKNPLVWSLAHNTGLATWLLDAQHHGSGHDYFDDTEHKLIDHNPNVMTSDDRNLVNNLTQMWKGTPSFSIVIKYGPHFPYAEKYPRNYHSQSRALAAPYVAASTRRKHYVNALDYQTGRFFEALIKSHPSSRTVIIYTSDHGQNVGDYPGFTHCNFARSVHVEEGTVPLLVLSNFRIDGMSQAVARNKGKLSQFDMVATLKAFLGYGNPARTKSGLFRNDGKSVSGFVYGIPFGRFGSKVHIESVNRKAYAQHEKKRWLKTWDGPAVDSPP